MSKEEIEQVVNKLLEQEEEPDWGEELDLEPELEPTPGGWGTPYRIYRLVLGDMVSGPLEWIDNARELVRRLLGPAARFSVDCLDDRGYARVRGGSERAVVVLSDKDVWLVTGTSNVLAAVDFVNTNPRYVDLSGFRV